ncbi:hypothetical protein [Angustibacter sp. Root456]|uniref:hypothetical protein n=1 Tax=Angustibacter sp. Root456 TaxID=1736539 RepID=UPI0012F9468C|nr:hypothetical protein [Angustibacter sp. Root456]
MKLSPLPVRRPGNQDTDAVTPGVVDLRSAEAAGQPAPLGEVLAWLSALES